MKSDFLIFWSLIYLYVFRYHLYEAELFCSKPSWLCMSLLQKILLFNPFVSNAPSLYHLKTSENRKIFWCFQGVEKGCIGNKWVKSEHFSNHVIWDGGCYNIFNLDIPDFGVSVPTLNLVDIFRRWYKLNSGSMRRGQVK